MIEIYTSVFLFLVAGFVTAKDVEKNIAFQVAKNFYRQAARFVIGDKCTFIGL
ncbi:MAG: hypothetical protein ABI763_12780 [Bacteroidota bacterium]